MGILEFVNTFVVMFLLSTILVNSWQKFMKYFERKRIGGKDENRFR